MNKKEFLIELENALNGKLPESDIREITSDYGDIFNNGVDNGRSEAEVAEEIGSPAKIARTILEDGSNGGGASGRGSDFTDGKEKREYTNFQKNINEKTSRIFDKVLDPDRNVKTETLAAMSRRLGAYIIDGVLLGVIGMGALMMLFAPVLYMVRTSSDIHTVDVVPMMGAMVNAGGSAIGFAFGNIVILFLLLGAFNLFTTIILWATNGFTPGKYFLKIRVVKIDGSKLGFLDALLRELVIKCIANSLLSGFLNLGSFLWGCVTEDHKTVHDLIVQTRVVVWNKTGK